MTTGSASPAASSQPTGRDERLTVVFALMLSMALVALDSTIVATAVPDIVAQFGGFSQFPWLFSVYLLTQAVSVPLYGRFADLIGRRPVLLLGIGLFVLGSLLCGVAWSMLSLILFRGLQGLGAGAVQPMTITIVGDLYGVEERGKVQGYMSSVWGAAAVIGPTLGGVFSEYLTWRWIFWVNLPVAALAVWMLLRHFHEDVVRREHRIDYLGAATLVAGCSLLILALLEGGVSWAWGSATSVGLFLAAAALIAAFVVTETRVAEPVLPLWVFGRRTLLAGNLASFAIGALTFGLTSYVPTFAQGVRGAGPLLAGFTLAALTVGWPIASTVAARLYLRLGFRDTGLVGAVVAVAGSAAVAAMPDTAPLWAMGLACFVVGVGLGFCATSTLVAVQSVVGWDRRGVVTGTNMFTRSVGSAVGLAAFGAIANTLIADRFSSAPAAIASQLPDRSAATSAVLGGQHTLPDPVAAFIRHTLYEATHTVFVSLVAVAVVLGVVIALMPRRTTMLDFPSSSGAAPAGAAAGPDAEGAPEVAMGFVTAPRSPDGATDSRSGEW
ncbi:MAG: MDR family MFS transporter [Actinomycetales bacterium]